MPPQSSNWRHHLWLALLVAGSVAFSLGFACATPLAAFGAVAALTLPRREYLVLIGAVWFANQVVGFGFLHYPWTANTLAWGVALGAVALLAAVAARATAYRLETAVSIVAGLGAFAAAFAAFQLLLYVVAAAALGGVEDFTASIILRMFEINAVAFVGLMLLSGVANRLGAVAGPVVPLGMRHA